MSTTVLEPPTSARSGLPLQPVVDELTRRHLLTIGAGLTALGLAGCGSPPGRGTAPSETVEFRYGDVAVTVPRNPQRVAVIEGRGDLEFALLAEYPIVASGVWPVGARPGTQFPGHVSGDVVALDNADGVNVEQLAALAPDLIVLRLAGYAQDWYGNDRLRTIAPLLPVDPNRPAWRDAAVAQLSALDRAAALAPLLADYDHALATAREQTRDKMAGRTVALLHGTAQSLIVWQNTIGTEVATDVGLELPFLDRTSDFGITIGPEQWDQLADIDLIIRQISDRATAEAIDAVPTWTALPAARAGHVHDIDPRYNNGLVLTATSFLAELERAAALI